MSYFDKANKLKAMGISAKFIPTIIGFLNGDAKDIPDEAMDELYDYYAFTANEMPYGTMKARDGDPHNWIVNKLEHDLGFIA